MPEPVTLEEKDGLLYDKALADVLLAHQPQTSALGTTLCACGMSFRAVDARAWHRHAAAMVHNHLAALPSAPVTTPPAGSREAGGRIIARWMGRLGDYDASVADYRDTCDEAAAEVLALIPPSVPQPAGSREDVEQAIGEFGAAAIRYGDRGCKDTTEYDAARAALLALFPPAVPEAETADTRDAKLWRWFRDCAWVGVNEDGEVCLSTWVGEPSDIACLTDAERKTFAKNSPEPKEMASLCQRIAEFTAALPRTGEDNG